MAVRQTTASEALAPAKPQTTSEKIVGSSLNRSSDLKTSDDSIDDDIDTRLTFQNVSSLCTPPETIDCFGNKDLPENKQIDSPVFSFVNNASPRKQPNASSTAFDVGNKDDSVTESCAASENGNEPSYPYTQCNPASSNHKLDCSWRSVIHFVFLPEVWFCSPSIIFYQLEKHMQVSFGFEWIDSLSCLFSTSHSLMKSSFLYFKKRKRP